MSTNTLEGRLTLLISTCEKYSDLWTGHMKLLKENWSDRGCDTVLLTDAETNERFDGVKIFSAGRELEMPERISRLMPEVGTEYILLTLDDYYPVAPVKNEDIAKLLDVMDSDGLDYIRLFGIPPSHLKYPGYDFLRRIDLDSKKDVNYQVNLYPGIWRKSFLEKTLEHAANAWNYEISLTATARRCKAKCAMTHGAEFRILDVVRKGMLLHKAAAYFRKHPGIYEGDRRVISRFSEIKIDFMTALKIIFNQSTIDRMKRILRRFGMKFYSDGAK